MDRVQRFYVSIGWLVGWYVGSKDFERYALVLRLKLVYYKLINKHLFEWMPLKNSQFIL